MTNFPIVRLSILGFVYVDELVVFDLQSSAEDIDPDLRQEIIVNWTYLTEKWGKKTLEAALSFADDQIKSYQVCDELVISLTAKGRQMGGAQ